ncbi:hypothetical protein DYB30_007567 [Aphanomyces astaci]|uniref:EF-hand domain-containing protein n=2 Tax=Aphanomyces astaci TaxID=112090 RepID=A0A397DV12_APHAT|nr:hypothetical protein DYB30_007567 [Aphanomyces astaci]
MLNNNLFFSLTLASPNDFTNPNVLKTPGDVLYNPPNIIANLFVYLLLGVLGAIIANLVLWVPYPMLGIRQLTAHTTSCAHTLDELLDLLVDAYCFKIQDVDHMKFLRLKLERKFDAAVAKHAEMTALLQDVWWEQLVGLHLALRFRRSSVQPFVTLFGAQVEHLRAMYQAMELERYEHLHSRFMASLQQQAQRMLIFAQAKVGSYFDRTNYPPAKLRTALKAWIAILVACFISVYTFGYSSTTPSAVAIVMSGHVGGSFRVTANRVGGIIAGTIVPSVVLFYICSYTCGHSILMAVLTNTMLFVWVTMSMFVCFKNGIDAYAGLIAAFTSTQVLMRGCDGCAHATVTPISSYANLAQLSLGVVLFVVVELAMSPHSAVSIVRANVQSQLALYKHCYETLVTHSSLKRKSQDHNDTTTLQQLVQVDLPRLLCTQASLLTEASFEPQLWRPPFSMPKYKRVLECCHQLYNHTVVLWHVVEWTRKRGGLPYLDERCRDWFTPLRHGVMESFETLADLFGPAFAAVEPDQVAMYIQIKEAFRVADRDGSHDMDVGEVKDMLGMIFAESGATKVTDMESCVGDFMTLVDTDGNGKVTLDEFKLALERGLKLHVQVPSLGAAALRRQSSIHTDLMVQTAPRQGGHDTTLRRLSSTIKLRPPSANPVMTMMRPHELLAVDAVVLPDLAKTLRTQYAKWFLLEHSTTPGQQPPHKKSMSIEELLLLNCLISAASGFATTLARLEELTVQP